MAAYMVQFWWGRALLHLAAALRAGHWSWHLAGIIRELRIPAAIYHVPPIRRQGCRRYAL
jgi:hypothetical protein